MERILKTPRSEEATRLYTRNLADALIYLHEHGVRAARLELSCGDGTLELSDDEIVALFDDLLRRAQAESDP